MEKSSSDQVLINNDFYETLNEMWYKAQDHPIALLRAENAVRTPWIIGEIGQRLGPRAKVLDIGCGGGLLANQLSLAGYHVTGVDISQSSLDIAKKYDETKRVFYLKASAYELPFQEDAFDVVCATDVLEHVDDPAKLVREASRVLRNGGLFLFHTFNRNLLSYLLIIKGVDWFVRNAPSNMHVYDLFITPKEMDAMCRSCGLQADTWVGLVPRVWSSAFWKMLLTRDVPKDFTFRFVKSLSTGYCGVASKHGS